MSSKSHEENIYSQSDMDDILKKLRDVEKEVELTHQVIWAIVESQGGKVAVPHRVWVEADGTKTLTVWDDLVEYKMHISSREVVEDV